MAVDGRFDHLLGGQHGLLQPLAQTEQSPLAMLSLSQTAQAVLDHYDRAIDDQAKIQRPQTHQVS